MTLPKHRDDPDDYRTCSRCDVLKPLDSDHFGRRGTTVRGGFRPDCRECKKSQDRSYYAGNIEKFQEYRAQHREEIAAYQREYWPRYYQSEAGNVAVKQAYQRYLRTALGKETSRAGTQRRRATLRMLEASFTFEEWQACLEAFGYACAYCGKADANLTQDHVVPLSAGGAYTANNIVPACEFCNSSKHDRPVAAWYGMQPFFSPDRALGILGYLDFVAVA
jgi:5-methylcytosine-specific restriction endonuclease McrA